MYILVLLVTLRSSDYLNHTEAFFNNLSLQLQHKIHSSPAFSLISTSFIILI